MLRLSISILTLVLRLMNDDHMMKLNSYCARGSHKQYFKERGICDKIYQYVTVHVLSETKLPHNSSPHDL